MKASEVCGGGGVAGVEGVRVWVGAWEMEEGWEGAVPAGEEAAGVWGDWGAVEERVEGDGDREEVRVVWVEGRVVVMGETQEELNELTGVVVPPLGVWVWMGVGVWARGEVGGGLMQERGVGESLKREPWRRREGAEDGEEQEGREEVGEGEGEATLGLALAGWA